MSPGMRAVARNIVAVLGLVYVFTLVLILKTIVWEPHITSVSSDSIDRTIVVHLAWAGGYFPAAFVAGMASSLVFESRRRWLWFVVFLLGLLPSLVSQDLRTWHERDHRIAVLLVAVLTAACAVAGFLIGERWFWKASRVEAT
jgi:hypothetical protein